MIEKLQNNKWLKIGLLAAVSLLLGGSLVGAGYWYGKSSKLKAQKSKLQLKSQNLTPTVPPVVTSQPTFFHQPTLSLDETAGWKVYTNTKYGYSVKHPSNLTPKEEAAADVFLTRTNFWDTANDTAVFGIEVKEANLAKAVEELKEDYQKSSVVMELQREDKIVHQGYTGYRLEYASEATVGTGVIVIINNNTYSYLLRSDKDTVDQILSTFKFLD